MKITFGKFEGPLSDEGVKGIFVDGVEVGHIERQIAWDYRGARTGTEGKVTGYVVEFNDEAMNEKHCRVFPPGTASFGTTTWQVRDFKTLGEAQRMVRAAYTNKVS